MKLIASITLTGLLAIAGCASRPADTTTAATPPIDTNLPKLASTAGDAEPASDLVPSTQPATAPSMPGLPKGHPDISKLMGGQQQPAAQDQPQLPKGHPDISKLTGGEQQPHEQPAGTPELPKGHPDISKLRASATQPVAGTLTVRAVQGTAGAPAVGADPITVEVYGNEQLIGKLDIKLDDDGTTTIDNIPTGSGYQVLARVTHGGVEFDGVVDANNRTVQLSIPVFESTETRPDWNVQMRHLIVQPADDGVHVMEVIAISNPADRAWLGEKPGTDGKRTVFTVPLPADAIKVQLAGGFHECCSKIENGKITNTMALVPGVTQYQFTYVVPATKGTADISASFAVPVKSMMVLVPEGVSASAVGLEGPKTVNMGNGNTQYFKGADLAANKEVKVTVKASGTGTGGSTTRTGAAARDDFDTAAAVKAIGGVGLVLVFLLGGAFMFMKSPRQVRSSRQAA